MNLIDKFQSNFLFAVENHKQSKTESIGNLLIPQIDHNLKENIMDCIQAKNLTPQHIALAPSISFE